MTLADAYNLPTEYQSGVNHYPLNLRSILAALFLPPFILRLLVIDVAAASFIQAFVAFLVGSTMGCLQKFLCSIISSVTVFFHESWLVMIHSKIHARVSIQYEYEESVETFS